MDGGESDSNGGYTSIVLLPENRLLVILAHTADYVVRRIYGGLRQNSRIA